MRLRLLLAYDGTAYSGWQIQAPDKAKNTVQGCLEQAFCKLCGQNARVIGSGRTDAGVHAHGQVAHVDLADAKASHIKNWQYSLNCLLPADIRILEAMPVSEAFHARKNVLSKTYVYRFWQTREFYPPLFSRQLWACGPLDAEAINKALPCLQGEQDYAVFQNVGTILKSTVRTIFDIAFQEESAIEFFPRHLPPCRLTITASGFLKQMARNIAGLLYYIGSGRIDPRQVPELINQKNRRLLPSPTAPACGLSLVKVRYAMEDRQDATPAY